MFLYDLEGFGKELKEIRLSCKMSQNDVSKLVGINTDSIRRLEKGLQHPTFDSVELLSYAYKVDVLEIMMKYRKNSSYIFRSEDEEIANALHSENHEKFKEMKLVLKEKSKNPKYSKVLDLAMNKIEQQKQFYDTLMEIEADKNKDLHKNIERMTNIIRISLPDFSVANIAELSLDLVEIRMISVLAAYYRRIRSLDTCLFILETLLSKVIDGHLNNHDKNIMIAKLYYNISYTYHIGDDAESARQNANIGIEYLLKNNKGSILPQLYFRKTIGELLVGDDLYTDSIEYLKVISKLYGNENIMKAVKSALKRVYNIDIELD